MSKATRYIEAAEAAGSSALAIDWHATFGNPEMEGACLPIAVYVSSFLTERGFPSRPLEAKLTADDSRDAGYMETTPGDEWSGHLVAWTPTRRRFVDASLQTQPSRILANLGYARHSNVPSVITGEWDHRSGRQAWTTKVGHGMIRYEFYPDRDGWRKRRWPYAWLIDQGRQAAQPT